MNYYKELILLFIGYQTSRLYLIILFYYFQIKYIIHIGIKLNILNRFNNLSQFCLINNYFGKK